MPRPPPDSGCHEDQSPVVGTDSRPGTQRSFGAARAQLVAADGKVPSVMRSIPCA